MPKDYAKDVFAYKRKTTQKNHHAGTWLLVLLVLLGLAASVYYAHTHGFTKERWIAMQEDLKSFLQHKKNPVLTADKAKSVAVANNNQNDEVHFDFYTELPNMKPNALVPDDTQNTVAVNKPAKVIAHADLTDQIDKTIQSALTENKTPKTRNYILQMGFFKNAKDASDLRVSLLLAGFAAEVVKGEKGYRVQQGPFLSSGQAKTMQSRLEQKGFPATVKRES